MRGILLPLAVYMLQCTSTAAQPALAYLTLLHDAAEQDGAVCLDGSPSAYYYRPGAEKRKFLIHTQGGGACSSNDDCYARSLTSLGSTKGFPATADLGGGYFSTDPSVNPMLFNWTVLYIPYIDGSFQIGDVTAPVVVPGKGTIYYRGARIVRAMISTFIANATINLAGATDVIISGCSAGGISTFMHTEKWAAALPPTVKVTAMPDSGFFLRYDYNATLNFTRGLRTIFDLVNASGALPAACVAAHPRDDTWMCMFPEVVAETFPRPIFPLQSEYDDWQLTNELPNTTAPLVNWYGQQLTSTLERTLLSNATRQNGVALDSCRHHCGDVWGIKFPGGYSQASAFAQWYSQLGVSGVQREWKQGSDYPCSSCCSTGGAGTIGLAGQSRQDLAHTF